MIDLLAPLGLVALAALAIPILIHLVRRSERKRVRFAALEWLSERTRPRKQLRLHERLLLALRLLLLTVLALLLAMPVWRDAGNQGQNWVAVMPGVDAAAARAAVDQPLADWHWLAPRFPKLDSEPPTSPVAIASLLRQLDAELPSAAMLTVVVPQQLSGLDAERLRLIHEIDWRVLPGTAATQPGTAPPSPLRIAIRYRPEGTSERAVVQALAKVWDLDGQPSLLDVASDDRSIPLDTNLLFGLSVSPSPTLDAWIEAGGTAFLSLSKLMGEPVLNDEASGQPLLRESLIGKGRAVTLSTALTAEATPALQNPEFPRTLRRLLLRETATPDRADAAAIKPQRRDSSATPLSQATAMTLENGFALLAALLFLAERLLATRQRREAA